VPLSREFHLALCFLRKCAQASIARYGEPGTLACYTAGFNDLSYFHRSFRKRFGVTPFDMRTEFAEKQ
jgi:AraC-like DNA-binding protein